MARVLATDLRNIMGSPSTDDFSADQATLCVSLALREWSRFKGPIAVSTEDLTTTKDTQTYALTTIENFATAYCAVREVLWGDAFTASDFHSDPTYGGLAEVYTKAWFDYPSQMLIHLEKVANLRRIYDQTWDREGNNIRLQPTPSRTGDPIWVWLRESILESDERLTDTDKDEILIYAQACGILVTGGYSPVIRIGPETRDSNKNLMIAKNLQDAFYSRVSDTSYIART